MIPNEQEAIEFHKRAGSNKEIIDHCKAVANVARKLADRFSEKGIKVDKESVYAAALLHDIGRTRTQTVHHGHIGAEIIREFGADEKIARIVSRHVGAESRKKKPEISDSHLVTTCRRHLKRRLSALLTRLSERVTRLSRFESKSKNSGQGD